MHSSVTSVFSVTEQAFLKLFCLPLEICQMTHFSFTMGLARPCGTDGQAGGRQAGAARDAQTRGHYFCSEPRPLIKPHGAAPPPSGPDEKHLCRPRPGPRPFQPAGRRAWPPTWSRAPGRGRALRPQPLLATATPLGRREARLSTPLTS